MRLDLVLLQQVKNLGALGAVCSVRRGYANFLLREKKALRATKENMAYFEQKRSEFEAQNNDRKAQATKQKETYQGKMLHFIKAAGDTGQLYGSIMGRDILQSLTAEGLSNLTTAMILLSKPIKTVGVHPFCVRLHPDVELDMYVVAAKTKDEAVTLEDAFRNPKPEPKPAGVAAKPKEPSEVKTSEAAVDSDTGGDAAVKADPQKESEPSEAVKADKTSEQPQEK